MNGGYKKEEKRDAMKGADHLLHVCMHKESLYDKKYAVKAITMYARSRCTVPVCTVVETVTMCGRIFNVVFTFEANPISSQDHHLVQTRNCRLILNYVVYTITMCTRNCMVCSLHHHGLHKELQHMQPKVPIRGTELCAVKINTVHTRASIICIQRDVGAFPPQAEHRF